MNLDAALRDLAAALAEGQGARGRDAPLTAARQLLASRCLEALGSRTSGPASLSQVVRLAASSPDRAARRDCAVLLVHALAVRGLVPPAGIGDVVALVEDALRAALLRANYPFGAAVEERRTALQRLHRNIGELLQPLEPTFPNWQGLYAG